MSFRRESFCIGVGKYAPWTDELMKTVFGKPTTKTAFVDTCHLSKDEKSRISKLETWYWLVREIASNMK